MIETLPEWLQTLSRKDLQPIVSRSLGIDVTIVDWQIERLTGGAAEHTGRGLGIYRFSGNAQANGANHSWSMILKTIIRSERPGSNDPAHPRYWKREMLMYQSGILDDLPGHLTAPRCYAIHELTDGECHLWLEDIHEIEPNWTMDHYKRAAQHLGQFSGAYLTDYPLPEFQSWMLPTRAYEFIDDSPLDMDDLVLSAENRFNNGWLSRPGIERMVALWEKWNELLSTLDRLPTCFCHHDAFRRNLMFREAESKTIETVAIDWSYSGIGKLGHDIGIMNGVNLWFMDVSSEHMNQLDDAVFSGYVSGLRDAGWQGDQQLARFGYTTTIGLIFGVAFSAVLARRLRENGPKVAEVITGYRFDEFARHLYDVHPFLLDFGDEALAMLPTIKGLLSE